MARFDRRLYVIDLTGIINSSISSTTDNEDNANLFCEWCNVKFIEKKDEMAHLGHPVYDWNLIIMIIGQYCYLL